ncbi:phosphatase PAP2 family protein [Pelagibius sp. 7325]|uniref:phosphatase PAP2 family protein n=1 Tax=Pelagibius sp. 7325 TaxID=3131994 RepID=UPI0030EEE52F
MSSTLGTDSLRPLARARSSNLPSPQRALQWLLALPEGIGAAILVVTAFSLTVLSIAFVYEAPLTIPRERVSVALGYSAVFPVIGAMAIYILFRAARVVLRRTRPGDPPLAQMIAVDITFMCLFLAATYFHFSLKTWVQIINPALYDDHYIRLDRSLQPVIDLFYWIRATYFTAVVNTDDWYQAAFLLMFISGFCTFAVTRNAVYPRFCLGVLLTMSLGALSYMVAPALGPFLFEEGLNEKATNAQAGMLWAHQQVKQRGMEWIAEAGHSYFTGALAAMPSLHIAHAVVMTWFVVQARSMLLSLFLPIGFWVIIESVASRWHYLIDLPIGALLAVFIIWLTHRLVPLPRHRKVGSKRHQAWI